MIETRRPNHCPESTFVSHDGQVTGDDEMPSLREAGDDAISLMRQLIQIDTTNTGDPAKFWRPFREELMQRLGTK